MLLKCKEAILDKYFTIVWRLWPLKVPVKTAYDIVCLRVEFQFLVYFVETKVKKTVL